MTRKFELSNDFHGTKTVVHSDNGFLNESQVRRAKKKLCLVHGCSCSNDLGTRGPNNPDVIFGQTSDGKIVAYLED